MIKICSSQISYNCFRCSTVQPYKDARVIRYVCARCATKLKANPPKRKGLGHVIALLRVHTQGG